MSGRSRIPTARSNINSARSTPSNLDFTLTQREKLNDPIYVLRPFSPESRVMNAHIERPPVLEASRYKTTCIIETIDKNSNRLTCSKEWIQQNKERPWVETVNNTIYDDIEEKKKVVRPLIERNRDRLWQLDRKYLNQTPRTVCNDMIMKHNFIKDMSNFYKTEVILNSNGSQQVANCIKDANTPGRDAFCAKTINDYSNNNNNFPYHVKQFRRGFSHTIEYGNFSRYNAVLQSSKGGLNR